MRWFEASPRRAAPEGHETSISHAAPHQEALPTSSSLLRSWRTHTVPHDQGGITDECDLSPDCRHCHRRKQAWGWKLEQPRPGVMTWTSPAGRRYTTLPSKHPTW